MEQPALSSAHSSAQHQEQEAAPEQADSVAPCSICRYAEMLLALFVGIFHGVAGAGGVLAIVPALAMKDDRSLSAAYLCMFFLTSILAMGTFAALWGELSARMGSTRRLECVLMACASVLSLLIGIIWEVLLGLDLLDVVFA